MTNGKYLLKFNTLPLPGVDKITPEIEVRAEDKRLGFYL
jgi:hypothetical protein